MNTESNRNFAPEPDAPLARLPEWQPPADFAVRLAAAAARQAATAPVAASAAPRWERWLELGTRILPTAVGAGLLALVLASLPWMQMAAHPAFATLIASSAGAAGLLLTWRLLRTP